MENRVTNNVFSDKSASIFSIFDISTFRRLMGAPEFEFKDLNKKVIKPAVEEINQLDSTITLETLLHKSGRSVQGIQFIVTAKRAIKWI
jgi:plasmid replication initiation protein